MKMICEEKGGFFCYPNAYLFWSGTRLLGSNFYTSEALYPICKQGCIKKILFNNHLHKHPEVFVDEETK